VGGREGGKWAGMEGGEGGFGIPAEIRNSKATCRGGVNLSDLWKGGTASGWWGGRENYRARDRDECENERRRKDK